MVRSTLCLIGGLHPEARTPGRRYPGAPEGTRGLRGKSTEAAGTTTTPVRSECGRASNGDETTSLANVGQADAHAFDVADAAAHADRPGVWLNRMSTPSPSAKFTSLLPPPKVGTMTGWA